MSRPKFASFGRMGDDLPGLSMSDALASDRRSIFREVMTSTKKLLQTQQSRQRGCVAASGFAFVPHTAVFLDGIRLGCRTGGEGVWPSPYRPTLTIPRARDGRPTSEKFVCSMAFLRARCAFWATLVN